MKHRIELAVPCLVVVGCMFAWHHDTAYADPAETTFVVAHRGLLLDAPENTLANFRACLELGLGFEMDVQRSKDGQLVCVHDDTVDRTTNGSGRVDQLTLLELKSLDAGSWFNATFRGQQIPTIDEVFKLLAKYPNANVLIAVDLKGDDPKIEADVVTAANEYRVLDRLLMIGRAISVPEVQQRLREANPQTHVATVANNPGEFDKALSANHSDWVYFRYVPSSDELNRVHAANKRAFIAGATVAGNQPENWRRVWSRGMDAVLTDYSIELARQLRIDASRHEEISSFLQPHYSPPQAFQNNLGNYRSPLQFADGTAVKTAEDWQRRRAEILAEWQQMLGPWPELIAKPELKIISRTQRENFIQLTVQVQVGPANRLTEGHLLIPEGKGPFPAALVTFYDSATSVGLGEKGQGTHDYGLQLVRRGFVTLSIGTPGSIEEPARSTRDLLTEAGEQQERQPLSYLAYAAANVHTVLAQLPEVDAERIGVVGLSYGGKWSMFASCLYDKFACAVWSDPGIVFNESNRNVNYWEPWYLGYEMGTRRPAGIPSDERPRTGLYKKLVEARRNLNDFHALICPRPVLLAGGTEDPPENWRALNHLLGINRLLGYDNRVAMTHRDTHIPTPEALSRTLAFLEYHLKYR